MRVVLLHLRHFRSHRELLLPLSEGVNILYGRNGVGKTNILEAVHFVCLTKSLFGASDAECLQFDAPFFEIEAEMQSDLGIQSQVRVYFSSEEGKHVFINRTELAQFSKIVGEYPCIALSPFDLGLVQGAPQERRRFLDNTISQANRAYLEDLMNYRRALNQRNKLLSEIKQQGMLTPAQRSALEVWTEQFTQLATAIIFQRVRFAEEFAGYLKAAYRKFASFSEEPALRYESEGVCFGTKTVEGIRQDFRTKLMMLKTEELHRGQTLLGPHRDDLEFLINHRSLRRYASQGQHKTFLICLKLAQYAYIHERLKETPIFLLDDVFSELDRERANDLIEILKPLGQSLITTTERKSFSGVSQIDVAYIRRESVI
ncbi:MAG: DNA replication/repair protein RecF [Chloroherpetonaceae bacterium]|nr:DNA replication/repair protein RecF [Chloroherpetonaceae bacterium]